MTETKTIGGGVVTVTYTTTSLIETVLHPTVEAYTTLAAATITTEALVYQTSTSLCPYTITSTIAGKEVVVVYTSTSLIVTQVEVPATVYTTALTTIYQTAEVSKTQDTSLRQADIPFRST